MVDIIQLNVKEFSEDRKRALSETNVDLDKLQEEINQSAEVKKAMKNDEKNVHANAIIELLAKTGISGEEQRRVLSCAYRTINSTLAPSTKKAKKSK